MTSSNRKENMKTLIDAAAQVSEGPSSIPFPFPNIIHPSTDLGFANNIMLPNITNGGPLRKRDHESALSMKGAATASGAKRAKSDKSSEQEDESKRAKRLEQNRTAAIESRRRKKHMVEELQRSVQYFSRANSALKSQNADLERQLLLAKHNILTKGSPGDDAVPASTTTNVTLPEAPSGEGFAPAKEPLEETTEPAAKLLPASNATSSVLTSAPPNTELEEQARQAQFAATQALYKSMGYPAGAARVAASTFSQFVGQTGVAPGLSAAAAVATSRESVRPSKRNSITTTNTSALPHATSSIPLILAEIKPSAKIESDGDAYIEARNQFAMQQAAAANAAAAAATAAIQAVNIHNQLKQNGGAFSFSPSSTAPSFPFSIPNTDMKSWPFQNASPYSTKE